MTPRPNVSIRDVFWEEALPTGCFVGVLIMVWSYLIHYQWFSATTNLYIWTTIWVGTCFISLHCLVSQGPLHVAAHGWFRNFHMLWNLYGLIGDERPGVGVAAEEVVGTAICTMVAVVVSYYFATRLSRPSIRGMEWNSGVNWPEKP